MSNLNYKSRSQLDDEEAKLVEVAEYFRERDKEFRYLTHKELEMIAEVSIPNVVSISSEVSRQARRENMNAIICQMRCKKIKLSKVPQLIKHIHQKYSDASIKGGSSVGMEATESISQPATQLSLNSFRLAGSKDAFEGTLNAFIEVLNMTKDKKQSRTEIHFNGSLTYEQVLSRRNDFVDVKISDVMESWEMITVKDAMNHKMYHDQSEFKYDRNKTCLRIRLDQRKLFFFKLTTGNIRKMALREGNLVRVSSTKDGLVDFYFTEKTGRTQYPNEETPFYRYMISHFTSFSLHGIKGLSNYTVVTKKISSIISRDEEEPDRDGYRRLWIDMIASDTSGISLDLLSTELTSSGYEIIHEPYKPEYLEDSILVSSRTFDLKSPVVLEGEYNYALVKGSNLKGILQVSGVNPYYTMSNDFREIDEIYGLEVARNVIEKEIYRLNKSAGIVLSPRHISLLTDSLIQYGKLSAISAKGVSKQGKDFITTSSNGKFSDSLRKIITGDPQTFDNCSSRIAFGVKIHLGTGHSIPRLDRDMKTLRLKSFQYTDYQQEILLLPDAKIGSLNCSGPIPSVRKVSLRPSKMLIGNVFGIFQTKPERNDPKTLDKVIYEI
jgi:hypothetical protein